MAEVSRHATRSGRCACGGVQFRLTGPLRQVTDCHCDPCRRITGHHMAATAADEADVVFDADGTLTWWERTDTVRYGFCSTCGATLFWHDDLRPGVLSVAAGSIDQPTGLTTELRLFADEAGDYHRLDPDVPVRSVDR